MNNQSLSPMLKTLIGTASVVIVLWGMKAAASILNLFFLALLLAYSILPLQNWLIRKKVRKGVALLLTIVLVLSLFLGIGYLLALSVSGVGDKLPVYQERLLTVYNSVNDLLKSRGIDPSGVTVLKMLSPEKVVGVTSTMLGAVGGILSNSFFILFIMILLLAEMAEAPDGQSTIGKARRKLMDYGADVQKYVAITAATGAINAAANVILMLIVGVDFAFLWGISYFFLNFIPNFGFIIAVIPPALLAFLEFGWVKALVVLVGFILTNSITDNVVKPLFMKHGLNVSPLGVILSLIFWGFVLGPVGAILAVPLTISVKRFLQELQQEGRGQAPEGASA
jgi:predicted PurR-regulated permease PerM